MDGLMGAIKGRRSGGLIDEQVVANEPRVGGAAPQKDGAQEMKGLVQSLDPSQKDLLLRMLMKEQKANDMSPDIQQKGAPGPGENMELEEFVSEFEPEEGHESEEEIMESMISSADKTRADRGSEPRNLGERVKIGLANKLKKKG